MLTRVWQRRDVWCRWTQAVYGPYALSRAVHRRIGGIVQVQTRNTTFRLQNGTCNYFRVTAHAQPRSVAQIAHAPSKDVTKPVKPQLCHNEHVHVHATYNVIP